LIMNISDELERIMTEMELDEKRKMEESNTAKQMALLAEGGEVPDIFTEYKRNMYRGQEEPNKDDLATQFIHWLSNLYFPGLLADTANVPMSQIDPYNPVGVPSAQQQRSSVYGYAGGGGVGYHQPDALEQNMLALGGMRAMPIIMALHKAAGGSVNKYDVGGTVSDTPISQNYSVQTQAPGSNSGYYANLINPIPTTSPTVDQAVLNNLKSYLGSSALGGQLASYAAQNNDPATASSVAKQLANASSPTEFLNILQTSDPTGQNLYSQMLGVATDAYSTTGKTANDFINASDELSKQAGRTIMPGATQGVTMTTGQNNPGAYSNASNYYQDLASAIAPSTTSNIPAVTGASTSGSYNDFISELTAKTGKPTYTNGVITGITPPSVPEGYTSWAQVYNDLYNEPKIDLQQAQQNQALSQTNPSELQQEVLHSFYKPLTHFQKVKQLYNGLLPNVAQPNLALQNLNKSQG
jgi:hypothetical protein